MKKRSFLSVALVSAILLTYAIPTFAEELKPIQLLKPQTDSGKPLMQVLKDRSSSRSFGKEKLSIQVLSNLLWAAFGVNRTDTGKRTAPSAMNLKSTTPTMSRNEEEMKIDDLQLKYSQRKT